MDPEEAITEAIPFTADAWVRWTSEEDVPPNLPLKWRIMSFVPSFKETLFAQFPLLRAADEAVLLLILAEGIARSGTVTRDQIETSLGIILPAAE